MSPKCLLIIDDDPEDIDILQLAFKSIGHSVEWIIYTDSEMAVQDLKERSFYPSPDGIFLDLNMPRKDGLQVLADIKEMNSYSCIPVIIHSTSIAHEEIDVAIQSGANYFLPKSPAFGTLCDSLKQCILRM